MPAIAVPIKPDTRVKGHSLLSRGYKIYNTYTVELVRARKFVLIEADWREKWKQTTCSMCGAYHANKDQEGTLGCSTYNPCNPTQAIELLVTVS